MRNFSAFPAFNYIGTPSAIAVQLSTGLRNIVAPLVFNWAVYGAATAVPNIVVQCDLSGNNVASQMGTVQSVFIDNLGSNISVYVTALDTLQTVCAQPNSEGWYPIYSNLMRFQVTGMGFITGFIPATGVMFSNLRIIPSQNIEFATSAELNLASNTISRGTGIQNTNYGTPALGDQFSQTAGVIAGTGVINSGLWGTPYANGFIYLTHARATVSTLQAAGTNDLYQGNVKTAAGVVLFTWQSYATAGLQWEVFNLQKANVKLDATQTYESFMVSGTSFGTGLLYNESYCWTWNPN
jgi:hypothetical protein